MNCPYCNQRMIYQDKGKFNAFCDMTNPNDDWYIDRDIHVCKRCGIKRINDKWKIPWKYKRPTKKQLRDSNALATIYELDFEPLLARQCKRFINKMLLHMYLNNQKIGKKELHIIGENIN